MHHQRTRFFNIGVSYDIIRFLRIGYFGGWNFALETFNTFRGILTGKFKRNEIPDPKGSRVGFIHADESKATTGFPAWNTYRDNEKYWQLMELIKSIGDKHGMSGDS